MFVDKTIFGLWWVCGNVLSCVIMSAVSWIWFMCLMWSFWVMIHKSVTTVVPKIRIFWYYGPTRTFLSFPELYQCWLNCQKTFFMGNPWLLDNVRHFAKKIVQMEASTLGFYILCFMRGRHIFNFWYLLLQLKIGAVLWGVLRRKSMVAEHRHDYMQNDRIDELDRMVK